MVEKTQLNLGHLVNSGREKRGDGFELRTDSWGAIRAGKGLFISTDLRAKASSEQLDIREAQQQLEDALRLVSSLKEAAEIAKAELADLAAQQKLLSQSIDEMKQAAMVLSSPMGIALTSPKTVQLSSNENITMSAQRQTDISVGKKITLAAGEVISLFAQRMGIKAFAAQGKVELQAQGDEMHLSSLKDMTVTSHAGKTIIAAKEELLLTCGGAFIRLKGGQIEYGSPGNQTVKASNWVVDENYSQALFYFQEAVKQGYSLAAFQLSEAFKIENTSSSDYLGVKRDLERVRRYDLINDEIDNNPRAKFPDIDKIVPLPPAPLPEWDGTFEYKKQAQK